MLLSQSLGLNVSQPMLDFVDVDLQRDLPLYIDPYGFIKPVDAFAVACQADIQDFFEAVLQAIISGDLSKGQTLLEALQEPNETHLGVSKGEPRGCGIGEQQAADILEKLRASPAAQSGLLSDLTDCTFFIEGIGPDKVSDITTNIIRRHLIEYTKQQFELLGQQVPTSVPAGMLWVTGESRWAHDEYENIPVISNKKLLLVPKRYVRWRTGSFSGPSHYYNHFVTNFIRDEELRTNGRLVDVIKTKKGTKRVVRKKRIRKEFPPTKLNIASFSVDNPGVYRRYKVAVLRHGPIGLRKLVEAGDDAFQERPYADGIIEALRAMPTGRRAANDYHHAVTGILTYLLYPDLITPTLESEINDGRKRIDVSFANSADSGFFKDRKDDPFTVAREVMFECKNYSEDVNNPEIDQLAGRFDPRRGRLGFVVCRSITDRNNLIRRCRDVFAAQNGVIIVLTDNDLVALLEHEGLNRHAAVQALMRERFRELTR